MRCKVCGAILRQIICDVKGRRFFECSRGLFHLIRDKQSFRATSFTIPCGRIYDERGNYFSGRVAFVRGNEVVTEKL